MKTPWIAALAAVVGAAQPALSQPADRHADDRTRAPCVARTAGESDTLWEGRTRDYCEVRWSDLVSHAATGRWTHPRYIDDCLRRCRAGYVDASPGPGVGAGLSAAPTLATTAGIALAIGAAVSMSGAHAEQPASP